MAFSPDGTHLASSGGGDTVRVWDLTTGREALALKGHAGQVNSVAFSPDGSRLASGGDDGTVRVWDAAAGREVLTLKGHTYGVLSVAFSPDGRRLASASHDGTVRVWDAATAREMIDNRLSREELAYRRALAAPDPARHAREAAEAERAGQPFAVLFHLDRAGRAHAERGEWDQARAHFERVTAMQPNDLGGWRRLALANLGAGQISDRDTCGRLLDFLQPTPEVLLATFLLNPAPNNAWGAALVLKAWQDSLPRRRQEQRLVVRPAVVRTDNVADPARLLAFTTQADPVTRGAALCRAGRHDEAAKVLGPVQEAAGLLYLALAEHGRGRPAAGKEALQRAVRWLEASSRGDPEQSNYARLPWDERLEVDLLRQEIEALLKGGKPAVGRKE
jgi:tetratricopeptide (TPR) repeat protein